MLLALISFPDALAAFQSGDFKTGILWLSSEFLQLVLLPVIIVGQRVISATQDVQAQADHDTLVALHQINVTQLTILELLRDNTRQNESNTLSGVQLAAQPQS